MRKRAFCTFVALLFLAGSARAADPPPSAEQQALFAAGKTEFEKGNYPSAINTWENLLATLGEGRGFRILYNLGAAYQATGDVTRAIERYRAFLAQVRDREKTEKADKALEKTVTEANARLGQLESTHGAVEVRAPRSGPVVLTRIGSGEPRPAGYTMWLAPGVHTIELNVGTQNVERKQVTIEAGKTVPLDTSPPEKPAPPPPPVREVKPPPPQSPGIPPLVWVGAGLTIASVSLPIITFVVADGKRDDAATISRGSTRYPEARDSYDSWRTLHYVSYAVPAVLAGLTIVYAVVARPSKSVTVGLAGTQLRLEGRF